MTTTVSITLDGVCAGQNHAHLSVSIDGGNARQFTIEADEVLGGLDWTNARELLLTVLKLHFRGRTKLQIRNELQAGPINLVI